MLWCADQLDEFASREVGPKMVIQVSDAKGARADAENKLNGGSDGQVGEKAGASDELVPSSLWPS